MILSKITLTLKGVVHFDVQAEVEKFSPIDELEGKLSSDFTEERLMRSVMQNDKKAIEEGSLIGEAVNKGLSAFIPDMMFSQLVNNYTIAKQLYGERMIRLVSGYDIEMLEKNINIPEFKKQLLSNIKKKIAELKDKGLIAGDGEIIDKGINFSALVMYMEELDRIEPRGIFGERETKKLSHYGEQGEARHYKKGDRFRDIAIRRTITRAIRRGRKKLQKDDLQISDRESKGTVQIIYGVDSSASMKGDKIGTAKKAGIALAYKAIQHKDKVGLIIFGKEVKDKLLPTDDFEQLLYHIARIRASTQTDFTALIKEAIEMFSGPGTKHLIILTDAMPTVGEVPEKETLQAISNARAAGISISVVGIKLDKNGASLAKEMATLGNGRFAVARDIKDIDKIILEDYEAIRAELA